MGVFGDKLGSKTPAERKALLPPVEDPRTAMSTLTGRPMSESPDTYRPLQQSLKSPFAKALSGGLQKTAQNIQEAPYMIAGLAAEGKLEGDRDTGSMPFAMGGSLPGLPKNAGDKFIQSKAKSIIDENPAFARRVEMVRNGETLDNQIFSLTKEQEDTIARWGATEVTGEGFFKGVLNVGKLLVGQTESLSSALIPGASIPLMYGMMYEEQMNGAKAEFEKRKIPWEPEKYRDIADLSSLYSTSLESIGMGVTVAGAIGKSIFKPLLKESGSIVLAGAKVAVSKLGEAATEATTEWWQQDTQVKATNEMLKQYAEETDTEYTPITEAEALVQKKKAAAAGAWVGGGMQVASIPHDVKQNVIKAVDVKIAKGNLAAISDAELTTVVETYKATAQKYGDLGVETADEEILATLRAAETSELLRIARSTDMTVPQGSREELIARIMENKMLLPKYVESAMQGALDVVNTSEKSALQKNLFKWMLQGELTPDALVQWQTMATEMVRNSGFDGTLEQFFEEKVELMGDKQGFLEMNQLYKISSVMEDVYAERLAGKTPEQIWEEYGIWVDGRGELRIEIDPDESTIGPVDPGEYTVGDLIGNSKLMRMMPDLAGIKVTVVMDGTRRVAGGSYAPPWKNAGSADLSSLFGPEGITIKLPPKDRGNFYAVQDILIHEVQHAMQNRQGTERGASVQAGDFRRYQRSTGEIEARLATERSKLSKQGRKTTPPWVTLAGMLSKEGFTEVEIKTLVSSRYHQTLEFFHTQTMRFNQEYLAGSDSYAVDGKEVSPKSALKAVEHAMEGTGFSQWWNDDSEFVTSEGKPLVMFHGTGRANVDEFNNVRSGIIAGHFSPSPVLASDFATLSSQKSGTMILDLTVEEMQLLPGDYTTRFTGEQVMPVLINANNVFDYRNPDHFAALRKKVLDEGTTEGDARMEIMDTLEALKVNGRYDSLEFEPIQTAIEALGFDGYFEREHSQTGMSNGRIMPNPGDLLNVAIFDPTKIKSVFNDGGFSPVDPRILYQRGRKLENSQVIRGQTQFLAEGKLTIDLFKTGDILSLAHEFAHALSPFMDNNMRDQLAAEVVKKNYPSLQGAKRDAQIKLHQRAWDLFAVDQNNPTFTKEPRTQKLLISMQEHMATQFELYLAKDTAPSGKLADLFKLTRNKMLVSYKELRKLPLKAQKVSHNLASNFDNLLAGDKALVRDQQREVILKDEETGEQKTYVVHQSKPQLAKHKTLLAYLARGYRANDGGMQQLLDYTKEVLGKINAEQRNRIALTKTRKEALKYIATVDVALAKQQEAKLETVRAKIRTKIKRFKGKGIDPAVRQLAENLTATFDPKRRTEKRVRTALVLKRVLADLEQNLGEVPATISQLQSIKDLELRTLEQMNEETLNTILEALDDLLRYNINNIKQHRAADMARMQELSTSMERENRLNQWFIRGERKASGKAGGLVKHLKSNLAGNLRTMRAFAMGPDSVWNELADAMVEGRKKQLATKQQFEDFMREIGKDIPTHGISTQLGTVSDKEKIKVKMYNAHGVEVEVDVTIGQIMMWYGWVQNSDGRKHLTGEGVFFQELDRRLSFGSLESLITIVEQLPQQYKDIVNKTMQYYGEVVHGIVDGVYREQNGIGLRQVENYLPLRIEWKGRDVIREMNLDTIGSDVKMWIKSRLKDQDFLHMRTGGKNAVYDADFFANIAENLRNVSEYVGMSQPIRDARVVFFGGQEHEGTASYQIKRMYGKNGFQELKRWLNRMEDSSKDESNLVKWIGRKSQDVRKAILKFSPSISAIQIVSIWGASNYGIKGRYLTAATVRGNPFMPKYSMQELADMDPALRERFEYTPVLYRQDEMTEGRTRQMWTSPQTWRAQAGQVKSMRDLKDLASRSEDGMLYGLKYMDAVALSVQLDAIEMQGKKEGWNKEEIMDRFLHIIRSTQPGNDPLFTSNFLGSTNSLFKVFYGPFQSQRDAIRGEIQTWTMEMVNIFYGQGKEGVTLQQCIVNIAKPTLISNMMVAIIQTAMGDIGDDDDRNFALDVATQMAMNFFGLIPILGDMISAGIGKVTRGYDFTPNMNLMLAPIDKALEKSMRGAKLWAKGYEAEAAVEFTEAALALTQLAGKSWSNIERWGKKFYSEFTD